MKLIICLLFGLLFSTQLLAENVCEPDCSIVIEFPTTGSLIAENGLVITFGNSGFIDTGNNITYYSEGGTLVLNEGESIYFEPGGKLDIGDSGNIEYIPFELISVEGVMLHIRSVGDNPLYADFSLVTFTVTAEGESEPVVDCLVDNSGVTISSGFNLPSSNLCVSQFASIGEITVPTIVVSTEVNVIADKNSSGLFNIHLLIFLVIIIILRVSPIHNKLRLLGRLRRRSLGRYVF